MYSNHRATTTIRKGGFFIGKFINILAILYICGYTRFAQFILSNNGRR